MPRIVKTITVPALGAGRVDYSTNVEYMVDTVMRSWQTSYYVVMGIAPVASGASVTIEIPIPANYVVMLYEVGLDSALNVLVDLEVQAWESTLGIWVAFHRKRKFQSTEQEITAGVPLFQKYRITVRNFAAIAVAYVFSAHGIYTDLQHYSLELSP